MPSSFEIYRKQMKIFGSDDVSLNYMTGGKSGMSQNDVMWCHMTSRSEILTKSSGYVLYTNTLLALSEILAVSLFSTFI